MAVGVLVFDLQSAQEGKNEEKERRGNWLIESDAKREFVIKLASAEFAYEFD